MKRHRQTPKLYDWARPAIAAIAVLGACGTAYLTAIKLMGGSAACPVSSCDDVLSSPYATVFGLPLTLFGFLAYASMAVLAAGPLLVSKDRNLERRRQLENWTWPLLFIGAMAMTVFSGYLMYLLAFVLQSACLYCITSATFAVTMLLLVLLGRRWEDVGQLLFMGVIVAVVVLTSTLGVYANVGETPGGTTTASSQGELPVTTTSGAAEIALARHLRETGAKMYGAWWCPHCHDQKQFFGKAAAQELNYVECAVPGDPRQQVQVCQTAGVNSYPTWEVNGQLYPGVKSLEELADLSDYSGPRDFANAL